jgi:hypothetical protein
MPSAGFCMRIPTPLDAGSTRHACRSPPGIAHSFSLLCLSDLRRSLQYKYRPLMIIGILPCYVASYPLPICQASALSSASFRFAVARDTLAVQPTPPLVGEERNFTSEEVHPVGRAAKKGSLLARGRPLHFNLTPVAPQCEPACLIGLTSSPPRSRRRLSFLHPTCAPRWSSFARCSCARWT